MQRKAPKHNHIWIIMWFIGILLSTPSCTTYMLHEKINGPTPTPRASTELRHFVIHDINYSELDTSKTDARLYTCVDATWTEKRNTTSRSENPPLSPYLIAAPFNRESRSISIKPADLVAGCPQPATPPRIAIDINNEHGDEQATEVVAFLPKLGSESYGRNSAIPFQAARFTLTPIYNGEVRKLVLPESNIRSNQLDYIYTTPSTQQQATYSIFIKPDVNKLEVAQPPHEFSSKDLLAVFYPFTIVWDVISTPFLMIFLAHQSTGH